MLKEPYTAKSYSWNSKYIKNALALRPPQADSLEIFARLCDILSLKKNPTTIQQICKRFSKTGLKYYNNRRKQYKTRQFRTMTVQMPDMAF